MLILYFFVLAFIVVVVAVYYTFLFDMVFGGHDFATTSAAVDKVREIIQANHKTQGILYDLGSSRGGFIFRILIKCPQLKALGVDNSRFRVWLSNLIAVLFSNRTKFLKGDIFAADVSKVDVVYAYLDVSLMERIQTKLQKELKPGAIAILNTQTFPSWIPSQVYITHPKKPLFEKLSVYLQA
jgi:hypothetical protein